MAIDARNARLSRSSTAVAAEPTSMGRSRRNGSRAKLMGILMPLTPSKIPGAMTLRAVQKPGGKAEALAPRKALGEKTWRFSCGCLPWGGGDGEGFQIACQAGVWLRDGFDRNG